MEEDKMKKLLIMVDTNVGGKGGAETHLWNLLSGIDQSKLSVDVIYFDADELDVENSRKKIQGVNFYRIPVRKLFSLSSVKYIKEIYAHMKSGNYDCVISFFETSDILAATLGGLAGIEKRVSNRRDTGFKNSKKIEFLYRYINRFFTHFIAVSEAVKESIISQGVNPEKVQVVYNAVDLRSFGNADGDRIRQETGIQNDEMVFGMVANLNPVKNHISVIEALSNIHKEGYKPHLVLAGEGVSRQELEIKVASLNLTSYVHFLGTRNDVVDILDSFDVFILASHTEGLSNALLEAMASRRAVIASRVGGNVEVVEDGVDGILVSTESSSIATAMKKLMDSEELRNKMANNAFSHVGRQFSLDKMLTSYMNIINRSGTDIELKEQTDPSSS